MRDAPAVLGKRRLEREGTVNKAGDSLPVLPYSNTPGHGLLCDRGLQWARCGLGATLIKSVPAEFDSPRVQTSLAQIVLYGGAVIIEAMLAQCL